MEQIPVPSRFRLAVGILAVVALAACAGGPTPPKPGAGGGDSRERRVTAVGADAARLQSQLLALADTALARVTAATTPGTLTRILRSGSSASPRDCRSVRRWSGS